jgi:adenylate kinase family enzyme
MIIQIIGLPGSGKTELAKALKERIGANIHSISATQKRKEMEIGNLK